ncbi:hypothetical protein PPL_03642 [Heterostelium album PN500]|uniref:Uncharacterized protein n=1 Tax=Heterostelium pallidum (strain ATCC 26659 / Pp 5 / PN500) TaxID=670386 RepID=D3B694_HETP5|nr:hypothetical protein PPL_03642 [Heterostelium album PN500]EFA82864.1 hypothetical protein PPL_03642 [Heterostelium album PN500]|eukprot:XP_020434981.1 hypothetical protein PPL_03642 [Heterostelium album PN500]
MSVPVFFDLSVIIMLKARSYSNNLCILLVLILSFVACTFGENDNSRDIPGLRNSTFIIIGIIVIVSLILLLVLFIFYCRVQEENSVGAAFGSGGGAWSSDLLKKKERKDGLKPLLDYDSSTDEDDFNSTNFNDENIV